MKTSKNIIDSISESNNFSKQTIRKVVNKTFEEIKKRLNKDDKVMLRGFMKFVCASKKKTKTYSIEDYQKLKTKNK
tara:strand:- start:634 stop:861 length:228 start_codon:yes stop_codon:yes gene_type:complete